GESARLIGAVNTVVRQGDRWIGENTDGRGFVLALRAVTDPAGKRVVLFGAGGAARAVAVELALAGAARITIVNRSPGRAAEVVDLLNARTATRAGYAPWDVPYVIPPDTDIVINNTSVGLYPNVDERLNIDFDSLRSSMVVADGIPNPPRTHLIREAVAHGCPTLDGLRMLVGQGVIALKYWTGIDADPQVMRHALIGALGLDVD
ncbi:MAG: shikimate dehydrogenase, partial [Rikenellaceae bacterium]|nr:shikimate dehydrogenase [Rikenellaceae bacterium]